MDSLSVVWLLLLSVVGKGDGRCCTDGRAGVALCCGGGFQWVAVYNLKPEMLKVVHRIHRGVSKQSAAESYLRWLHRVAAQVKDWASSGQVGKADYATATVEKEEGWVAVDAWMVDEAMLVF